MSPRKNVSRIAQSKEGKKKRLQKRQEDVLFSFPLPFPTRFLAACVNPICKFLDVHIYIYRTESSMRGKATSRESGVCMPKGLATLVVSVVGFHIGRYWGRRATMRWGQPPPPPLSHSLSKLRVKRVRKTEIVQGGMGLKLRVTVRVRMNIGRKGGLLKRRTKPDT